MFLMYVDECGDCGTGDGSSDYFILSAMVVHESQWTTFMSQCALAFDSVFERYGIPRRLELHAKETLGRSGKDYSSVPKNRRVMAFKDMLRFEATLTEYIRIINVIVDKGDKGEGYDVFEHAWNALINRFENTIRHANFRIIKPGTQPAYPEHGLVLVDQTEENKLRYLIRRMRHMNIVPSAYGGEKVRNDLAWVIEDAMHKNSRYSLAVQLCDANAYFLRQLVKPNSTIRKYDAGNYFYFLEPVLLKEASRKDPLGIVRL